MANQHFHILDGAGTKNRTRDLLITSQLLYQLSYTGIVKVGGILAIFFSYARGYFLISAYFYKYWHQVFEFYADNSILLIGRDKSHPMPDKKPTLYYCLIFKLVAANSAALNKARSLFKVSCHSDSGTESATTPAPA